MLVQIPIASTKNRDYHDNFCSRKPQEDFLKKQKYKWPRPAVCPRCQSHRVWGHGFVPRFFDGFSQALLMRRYRCPDCGVVITMRSRDYLPRFQAPLSSICKSLINKHYKNRWLTGLGRTRQQFWWNAFKRRVAAVWGNICPLAVKDQLETLLRAGFSPVSRTF